MNFTELPKVELHLHLEGGAPPAFIKQLAHEKKIDISGIFTPDGSYTYRDFWHFLDVYEAATSTLTGPEEFHRLVLAVLAESAAHGVIYTEAFLSPDFCGGGDVSAWKEYLHAMQEAAAIAEARHGIILRGIITPIRHFGPEKARATAICAQETAGDWIVGFGMGGDERQFHPTDFAYAFDMAREAGLKITSHAGEWCGPQSVRDTLDVLNPARIGHGVQAIEDAHLVDRLAETGTVLEVCPGSNVFLGVYPTWDDHPIQKLRDAGVAVTVSTDDPPFFNTDMTQEYRGLADTFGWGKTEFGDVNRTAAGAAFCDDATRKTVLEKLEPYDA